MVVQYISGSGSLWAAAGFPLSKNRGIDKIDVKMYNGGRLGDVMSRFLE